MCISLIKALNKSKFLSIKLTHKKTMTVNGFVENSFFDKKISFRKSY